MSETDILEGGAVAEEAIDKKRGRRQLPERCYACDAAVYGPWCWACGQKNDDCRRSITILGFETLRDVSALDGRFLRTLRSVITRPGRHLREYGDGKRSPYSPPVRFFLLVTFVFFLTLELTDRQILTIQPKIHLDEQGEVQLDGVEGGFLQKPRAEYTPEEREAMRRALSRGLFNIGSGTVPGLDEEELPPEARDAIEQARAAAEEGREVGRELKEKGRGRTISIGVTTGEDVPVPPEPMEPQPSGDEPQAQTRTPGKIVINGREIQADRFADAFVRLIENPRVFNNALDDWIGRLMILMIPLMALLGAVFVRGRDALLYDHLLLSLNTHAIAFGIITLGIWTSALIPGSWVAVLFFLGVPLYYGAAMKGGFGRRKRKVIPATFFVFFVYGLVFSIALGYAVVSSFGDIL